jgi:hypothetical protein
LPVRAGVARGRGASLLELVFEVFDGQGFPAGGGSAAFHFVAGESPHVRGDSLAADLRPGLMLLLRGAGRYQKQDRKDAEEWRFLHEVDANTRRAG